MSLVNCPECGHQVSAAADACPNCGHPFTPPTVKSKEVIHASATERRDEFPKWILIPLGILGVLFVFILFMFMQSGSDDVANRDIDVNINARGPQTADGRDVTVVRPDDPPTADRETVVAQPDAPGPANPPQTIPPNTQTTVIDEAPDKGTVNIEAKVTNKKGETNPVDDEKFYLLDKRLEDILRDAEIKSIGGQNLINTFGLSVLYPDKYGETNERALEAIEDHVKYDALSDREGKAQIRGVDPGQYYLFAITKTKTGFAVWSAPVSIRAGENRLVLPPARLTEVAN